MSKEENIHTYDWMTYYTNIVNKPPRDTVILANKLSEHPEEKIALDLGCGSGRDSKFLLGKKWSVVAIDGEKAGVEALLNDVGEEYKGKLKTQVSSFKNIKINKKFDLINSSYALPYCEPEYFPDLWTKIRESIKIGGRFSGHLFGLHDEMVKYTNMNFHSKEDISRLFENFEFEFYEEEESDGPTASGRIKHWHIFHIVAKKNQLNLL